MSEKEKKKIKMLMKHQRLLKKFLIIIKKLENFHRASKVDKRTFKLKIEESIAERTKLRRQKLNITAKKKKKHRQ